MYRHRITSVPTRAIPTITESENQGASIYHSLQVNFRRRLTKGLLFGAAYTWSKSLDYGSSNGTNLPNAYDKSIFYGPSDFDTRHVLVLNYVWEIPFATHSTNFFERTTLWQLAVLWNHSGADWHSSNSLTEQ